MGNETELENAGFTIYTCDGGDAVELVESMLLFDFVRFDESDSKSSLGA